MKPTLSLISGLRKGKGEDGREQYLGTMDAATLRKCKAKEIDIVLIPVENIPKCLVDQMRKAGAGANIDMLMFAGISEIEQAAKPKAS